MQASNPGVLQGVGNPWRKPYGWGERARRRAGVRFFRRAAVDWVWIDVEGEGKVGS